MTPYTPLGSHEVIWMAGVKIPESSQPFEYLATLLLIHCYFDASGYKYILINRTEPKQRIWESGSNRLSHCKRQEDGANGIYICSGNKFTVSS